LDQRSRLAAKRKVQGTTKTVCEFALLGRRSRLAKDSGQRYETCKASKWRRIRFELNPKIQQICSKEKT
jgi:hypothetical protein